MNANNYLWFGYTFPHEGDCYMPKIASGDTMKYYANIGAISATTLDLYSYDLGGIFQSNVVTWVYAGYVGKYYFEWEVGELPPGKYCFKDHDVSTYTNPFCYIKNTDDTLILKYRNSKNIFRYMYESLTSWYSQIRIDANILPASPGSISEGFSDYPDQYHRAHAFTRNVKTLNVFNFDEYMHQALFVALVHDEVYLDGVRYVKPPENGYNINWPDTEHKQADATVNLEVYNDYNSILL